MILISSPILLYYQFEIMINQNQLSFLNHDWSYSIIILIIFLSWLIILEWGFLNSRCWKFKSLLTWWTSIIRLRWDCIMKMPSKILCLIDDIVHLKIPCLYGHIFHLNILRLIAHTLHQNIVSLTCQILHFKILIGHILHLKIVSLIMLNIERFFVYFPIH